MISQVKFILLYTAAVYYSSENIALAKPLDQVELNDETTHSIITKIERSQFTSNVKSLNLTKLAQPFNKTATSDYQIRRNLHWRSISKLVVPESEHQSTTLTLWDFIKSNTNHVPGVKTFDTIRHVKQHSQKSHRKHRNRRAATPDQSDREEKNDKGEIREIDDELEWESSFVHDPVIPRIAAEFHFPRQHIVELLVIIDLVIYNRWLEQTDRSKNMEDRKDDAVRNMRYYYSHMVNGINLRFANVDEPDYRVDILLKEFYFITTQPDASFMESSGVCTTLYEQRACYSVSVLDNLQDWLAQKERRIPQHDHALLVTGNKLISGKTQDKRDYFILGAAYIAAMCTEGSVSVLRENGLYSTALTASHEIGHSLGAYHDTSSRNDCPSDDQYIMAPYASRVTPHTRLHPYSFSTCSKNYFYTFLWKITQRNMNCLLEEEDTRRWDIASYIRTPPGQRYTTDQQCVILYGSESFYCGGHVNDLEMCNQLECYSPDSEACERYHGHRAHNGTTCGDNKWCQYGLCVQDSDAPSAYGFCLSGDYRLDIHGHRDCQAMVEHAPWLCYDEENNHKCCASCQSIRNISNTNCEFGNKVDWCSKQRVTQCYSTSYREDCCATCNQHNTGIKDCEYGDSASWCQDIGAEICYKTPESQTCCATCRKLRTDSSDCPYGDRSSWCTDYVRRNPEFCLEDSDKARCCQSCNSAAKTTTTTHRSTEMITTPKPCSNKGSDSYCGKLKAKSCYWPSYNRYCCDTCRSLHTLLKGCEYGDRVSWCSNYATLDHCAEDLYIQKQCCLTCHNLLRV